MPGENLETLIEFTRDDEPSARALAIAGLARIGDSRGFAPVLVALFDPVDEVRATAATALGVFGDMRAFEALVEGLDDPCEQVSVNCAWAMGQIPDSRCLDKLFEIVADESLTPMIRTAAITALGERSAIQGSDLATSDELIEQARVLVLNTLDDESRELRAACVWMLGHLPADKQTIDMCIELLEDEYEWVVRYAIEALAYFGDVAALEPLEELADSDNPEIADLARRAVYMLH